MARYEVEGPDGNRYEVEAPDDWDGTLSPEEIASFSESTLDWTKRKAGEFADLATGKTNDFTSFFGDSAGGVLNTIGNVGGDIGAGLLKSIAGVGLEINPESAGARDLAKKTSDFQQQNWEDAGFTPGSAGEFAGQVASAAGQMYPALMMGPVGSAAYFGLTAGGNRAADATNEGYDQQTIDKASLASSAIGALAGAIPGVGRIKAPASKAVITGLSWAGIPYVMDKGEVIVDESILDKKISDAEKSDRSVRSIATGLILGPLAHAFGKARARAESRKAANNLESKTEELYKQREAIPSAESIGQGGEVASPLGALRDGTLSAGKVLKEAPDAIVRSRNLSRADIDAIMRARSNAFEGVTPEAPAGERSNPRAATKAFEPTDVSPEFISSEAMRAKIEADTARTAPPTPEMVKPQPETPQEKTWIKNVRDPETGVLTAEKSLINEAQQKLAESKQITTEKIQESKAAEPQQIVPKIEGEKSPAVLPGAEAKTVVAPKTQVPKKLGPEAGVSTLPADIISGVKGTVNAGREFISKLGKDREINRQVEAGIKDGSILTPDEQLPRFEKMLRGDVSKRDLPDTARKFAGAYHKWTTFVRTAAERSPEVRKWYDSSKEELKITHVTESELLNKLQPYIDLVDSAKVDEFLRIQRRRASEGKSINESDANLKALNFAPEEVKALRAVRETMDAALEQYKKVQLETADGSKPLQELHSEIEALRAAKYVPFGRFGDWRVDAIKDGKPAVFFEESKSAALKRAGMLKTEGYQSTVTERVLPKDVPYRLPNELTEPGGFKKHLIEAKLTKGENENLKKSIGEYVVNLAKYSGFKLTSKARAEAFETLKNSKQAKTYEWLTKVDSDFHSPTHGVVRGIRNFMYNYYLRLNPGSALVNLTQPFTVTYPLLSKEVKWSGAKTVAAYKDVTKYITTGKTGDAGLDSMLARARKENVIGDNIHRDWLEMARTGKGKSLISKIVPDMFAGAEYINRLHAFSAGYKAFKSKGLQGEALYKRVADFVDQSQFQYGKINSPLMARGGFAAPMTFRLWLGNYLSLLGKSMHQGDYGVATRLLGTMAVLGGGAGMPFVKDVFAILESQDKDPRKWLRDKWGKSVDDYFSYGLAAAIPEQYRPNVTGKVGVGEMVQDVDKGNALATVGRAALGATADPILRTQKAVGFAMDGNLGRAVETMLPEGLPKGVSKLYRATRMTPDGKAEVGMRNPRNEPVMTDADGNPLPLSTAEKVMLVGSIQPSRLSDAYRRQHSMALLTNERSKLGARINQAIAMALYNNDTAAEDAAYAMADELGIQPNDQSIEEHLNRMESGSEISTILNAPKDIREELYKIYEQR